MRLPRWTLRHSAHRLPDGRGAERNPDESEAQVIARVLATAAASTVRGGAGVGGSRWDGARNGACDAAVGSHRPVPRCRSPDPELAA
jgi:hypothetical protein